ncbi:hypothetical protein EIP91_002858 [Steccherinum ochraceum]|uniref:RGS domain-containing protein n=1 Tax=Steccherinum ochraceum TaxID=92696 RepID=A0A4R0RT49_9APHY|nr:hypothetical protein EIP91_002858 [Steccherinum ochraceum]
MPLWRPSTSDNNVAGPSRLPIPSAASLFARRPSDAAMIAPSGPVASAGAAAVAPPPPLPVPSTPAPGLQYASSLPPQTQPRTVKLTPSAILSLPHRLAHPPAAKNQVHSWGVIPAFDIRLEDILDRKHLPPLGLKDFEEWLLFVDNVPENLYFILWLREYTSRYTAWAQQSKREHEFLRASTSSQSLSLSNTGHHPIRTALTDANRSPFPSHPNTTFCHSPSSPNLSSAFPDAKRYPLTHPQPPSPCPSPSPSPSRRRLRHHHRYFDPPTPPSSLALFYLRAKETFLTPNAPYELDVHSDVLSVFHLSSSSKNSSRHPMPLAPPPDPAIFNELASIVEEKLKESLAKFVVATYNNVGMPRAHCGSAGGLTIGIVWSAPILAANFSLGGARWWRVLALPGMWLGLTVFISAMYGVCMMIYIFGDLRQLRSFELSRPSISPPRRLTHPFRDQKLQPNELVSAPVKALTRPPKARVTFSSAPPAAARPVLRIDPPTPPRSSEVEVVGGELSPPPSSVVHTPTRLNAVSPGDAASFSSYSYEGSDSDSHSESDSATPSDSESDTSESETDSAKLRQSEQNQRRRPRIIISDAFYDEHPSPEGPATATEGLWNVPMRQVRVPDLAVSAPSRRGSVSAVGGAEGGMQGFWSSEYEGGEEETNVTAGFIKPFMYDFGNYRFGTAPYLYTPSSRSNSDDIEQQRTADLQPIDSFDFDSLPPARPRQQQSNKRPHTWTPGSHAHAHSHPHNVVGIIHSDNGLSAHATTDPSSRGRSQDQKPCWPGQMRMKLGVEVVPPKQTDAEGRVTEKPKSATPAEGVACIPGDAGSDADSIRGLGGRWRWFHGLMGRAQSKCSPGNAVDAHRSQLALEGQGLKTSSPSATPLPTHTRPSAPPPAASHSHPTVKREKDSTLEATFPIAAKGATTAWRERFKKVSAVPAFASPLTPVLNPVVGRAQWEIVIRSALMAIVISVVVIGALLSVPVRRELAASV